MDVTRDSFWMDVAEFLNREGIAPADTVAPSLFDALRPGTVPYGMPPSEIPTVRALVVHKGMVGEIGDAMLAHALCLFAPAFANEVFVVYTAPGGALAIEHVKSFAADFAGILRGTVPTGPAPSPGSSSSAVYLGRRRALTRTMFGHKILVDTDDLSLSPHLLLGGEWERWIANLFRGLCRPGATVIDVGANVGFYALLAAGQVGQAGRVIAFEANPALVDLLSASVDINGFLDRCTVENLAVYSHEADLTLNVPARHRGSASLWRGDAPHGWLDGEITVVQVRAVTLDAYFPPGTKIDVLKMDIEGAELAAFQGARRLLSENPDISVIAEFTPSHEAYRSGAQGVICMLVELGLEAHRINEDESLSPMSFDALLREDRVDVLLRRPRR
jgi:FkbM family methyltransferase